MRSVIHNFDHQVTTFVKQWHNLDGLMIFLSVLGHPIVTLGIGAAVIALGTVKSNARVIYAGLAVFATIGLGSILKLFLQRDRPLTEYVAHMLFSTFSFPSGHSVGATIAYGLLGYLGWQMLPQPWGVIAAVLATVLIIAIGVSRIYLGAHYPSDVVAGWLLGIAGLIVIIFIIKPAL